MEEKEKDLVELTKTDLDEVSGGFEENEAYYRAHCSMLAPPKYCCPKCFSWNIINYDPGVWRVMRIACYDCGYVGERGDQEKTSLNNPYIGWNKEVYHFPDNDR